MPAYAGSITPAEAPLLPLGLVPLAPLLAAALVGLFGGSIGRRRALGVSLGSTLLAFALALASVAHLFSLDPPRRALAELAFRLARVGSLDASVAFLLEPSAVPFLLAAPASVALLHAVAAPSLKDDRQALLFAACAPLFSAGAALVALAANLFVWLFGAALVALATYLLLALAKDTRDAASAAARALAAMGAGGALILFGFSWLFWGLGGAWIDGGHYLADVRPRFVAVYPEGRLPAEEPEADAVDVPLGERDPRAIAERAQKRGMLTFTSYPGARVFVGVSDHAQLALSPAPFAIAPFARRPIAAGTHAIAVVPGGGAVVSGDGNEVAYLEHIAVPEGEEVRIVPVGPTFTFHELRDQMLLRDAGRVPVFRRALVDKRGAGSISLVTLVALLLFVGAAMTSAALAFTGSLAPAARALVHGLALAPAPLLLARASVLFDLSSAASSAAFIVGDLVAALAALRAATLRDLRRALPYVSIAVIGLALAAVGGDEPRLAVILVAGNALASVALCFHLLRKERTPSRRSSS